MVGWTLPERGGLTFDLLGEGDLDYLDDGGQLDTSLEATTSNGGGGFVNVRPGVREVEFGGDARDCKVWWGWPSDAENTVRMPLQAGFLTVGAMSCDRE